MGCAIFAQKQLQTRGLAFTYLWRNVCDPPDRNKNIFADPVLLLLLFPNGSQLLKKMLFALDRDWIRLLLSFDALGPIQRSLSNNILTN